MLTETLSQMESPPAAAMRERGGGGGGEQEQLDSPAQLAQLRKKVLRSMLEQLYLAEMAGGMRSICFMKVCEREFHTVWNHTHTRARTHTHTHTHTHMHTHTHSLLTHLTHSLTQSSCTMHTHCS